MSDSDRNIKPTYKNEPAYRVASILFPGLIGLIFILFIWFSRDESRHREPRTITLYCFSAMEEVMEQGIMPAFQASWLEDTGETLEFITTFAGSGVITRQIMTRFPAELAILSSELDAQRLLQGGVITATSMREIKEAGRFCRSPVVLFINKELVLDIQDFDDINFDSLDVVIPNPLTSGEGQMAALALYGAKLRKGSSPKEALGFTKTALAKTKYQPSSSREAMEQFHAGIGDVLLNHEAASHIHKAESPLKVIIPQSTLITEPVALTIPKNITPKQEDVTEAFLAFLWGKEAQLILSEYGFQTNTSARESSFSPSSSRDVFTLDSLGAAMTLNRNIIDQLVSEIPTGD